MIAVDEDEAYFLLIWFTIHYIYYRNVKLSCDDITTMIAPGVYYT